MYEGFINLKLAYIFITALPTLKETKYYNETNKEILTQQGFDVKTINCDALSKEGGSLHCLSYTF